jgi:hypothetical protein
MTAMTRRGSVHRVSVTVFRVRFDGDDLDDTATVALIAADAWWEGTESRSSAPCHHRALVEAEAEAEAIEIVKAAVEPHGDYTNFIASPVTDAKGEVRRGPFYRRWREIDWQATPERAKLTELEQGVLFALADGGVWTAAVVTNPDVPTTDRAHVEAALERVQSRKLVFSTVEYIGHPVNKPGRWWAITDEGWDLLGIVKSPRYR